MGILLRIRQRIRGSHPGHRNLINKLVLEAVIR